MVEVLLLAPVLIAAVVAAYVVGHRRGGRAWREQRQQEEIEARLLGLSPKDVRSTAERGSVHIPRMESSHSWDTGNNGDS